jgi:hypothetical protein
MRQALLKGASAVIAAVAMLAVVASLNVSAASGRSCDARCKHFTKMIGDHTYSLFQGAGSGVWITEWGFCRDGKFSFHFTFYPGPLAPRGAMRYDDLWNAGWRVKRAGKHFAVIHVHTLSFSSTYEDGTAGPSKTPPEVGKVVFKRDKGFYIDRIQYERAACP